MKADPILQEVWDIKDRLAAEAGYDMRRFGEQLREWEAAHPHLFATAKTDEAGGDARLFLEQMDAWLDAHPHTGPVVNSPEELQARVRLREANEPLPEPGEPYRIYNPIIAEIHRIRADLSRERPEDSPVLREEPPKPGG